MQAQERQFVLDNLDSSLARLLTLTATLTPAQWNFREQPERWSIAENLEHCLLVEMAITHVIQKALASPAEPEKKAAAAAKEPYVLGAATPQARARGLVALEPLQPTGRFPHPPDLLVQLKKIRAQSLAFARETDADLRDHFLPHQALGDLDCYQWLVIMAVHGARHAAQIDEIKADPNYPAA